MVNLVQNSPAPVSENRRFYWLLWYSGWTIISIMMAAAALTWSISLFDKFGIAFNGGSTAILFAAVYVALSLREVRADEVAAAFFYGKALVILPSGLHFVPFGLMQIRKGSRPVQEFQSPGEPEKVFKGLDTADLPPGMVRPIRIVTGGTQAGSDDILNTRMTITISFFVQWVITDILLYTSNYGSSDQIEKQARDIGEAILAEIAREHTPASFICDLKKINRTLTSRIGRRFRNSGINIISTRLISPDISHDVSKALADIPKVRAETEQVKIRAEGSKVDLVKKGEGTAAAELALLNARATGRKKIKDELGVSGDAVLASESVREVLKETDVLVVGAEGGMKDVMGLVKGAQSALNSSKKGTTP